METSTINQIIETGGYIAIAAISIWCYMRVIRFRSTIEKETVLLKDCIFYREVIVRYKRRLSDHEDTNLYNTIRSEVESDIGFASSRYSQPKALVSRLSELNALDEKAVDLLKKLKFV